MASTNETKQEKDTVPTLRAVLERLDARSRTTREELNKLSAFVRDQSALQCEIMSKLSDQVYRISELLDILPPEPIPEEHNAEDEGDDDEDNDQIDGEAAEEQEEGMGGSNLPDTNP